MQGLGNIPQLSANVQLDLWYARHVQQHRQPGEEDTMAYAIALDPMTMHAVIRKCGTMTDATSWRDYWMTQHYIHAVAVDSWAKVLDYYDEHGK